MRDEMSLEKVPPGDLPVPTAVSAYTVGIEEGEDPSFLDYWRVVRKRRWTVISFLVVVVVTVMIGTLKQRPVYRATAVVQIDKESPSIFSFKEFVA